MTKFIVALMALCISACSAVQPKFTCGLKTGECTTAPVAGFCAREGACMTVGPAEAWCAPQGTPFGQAKVCGASEAECRRITGSPECEPTGYYEHLDYLTDRTRALRGLLPEILEACDRDNRHLKVGGGWLVAKGSLSTFYQIRDDEQAQLVANLYGADWASLEDIAEENTRRAARRAQCRIQSTTKVNLMLKAVGLGEQEVM